MVASYCCTNDDSLRKRAVDVPPDQRCHMRSRGESGPAAWRVATANAFQVLIGALSGCVSLEDARHIFEDIPEPLNEYERLLFRSFVGDLLIEVFHFSRAGVHRSTLESILQAWPTIRRHPRPVSILREILTDERRAVSTAEFALAEGIRELLERRYSERLRLRDIAATVGATESMMNRCFRLAYRSSIHQHLLNVRVRHGLEIITDGVKVEAAALAVGFRSKKDFYRAVRHFVGCTPAQFRSRTPGSSR